MCFQFVIVLVHVLQELRGRGNFFAQDLPHNRPVLLLLDRQVVAAVQLLLML